jgi:uncharacterized protein (DUF427 family)
LEASSERIRIYFNGVLIAETTGAYRVLETSHPPGYYLPQADIQMQHLVRTDKHTVCEFKGRADYWTLTVGEAVAHNVAWSYPQPNKTYAAIADYLAFYPGRMESCWVDEERVQAQEGDFYGGWITSKVVGPFKGGPGTWGW